MTRNHWTVADWKRLGLAVQGARMRQPDLRDMNEWASVVGRSPRLLQGLERGERVGAPTLRLIEEILKWRTGYAEVILSDPSADTSPDRPRAAAGNSDPLPVEARPLDEFTTDELLEEVNSRYNEIAYELHRRGVVTMTKRQEGAAEVWEPMSPAEARRRTGGRS